MPKSFSVLILGLAIAGSTSGARNATSVVPERIECWKNNIRKLDVMLRQRPARKH